jgi:starvation-inducible DNA-binding protein
MESVENTPVLSSLRREQANAVQLYLQYKGYHWNVAGPQFRDLHLLFDEHAKEVLDTIDPLAERQRILGAPAEYSLEALRRLAVLGGETRAPESPKEMVERLLDSHRLVLRGLRSGVELATRAGDPGSADLFTRCTLAHEKMEWFLRELLETHGGLEVPALASANPIRTEGVAQMGF